MAESFDRFRSFAERYVISRSASFRAGHEEEDGYMATLQARTIYNNIQVQSESPVVCDNRPYDDVVAVNLGGATQAPGATGAFFPLRHPSHMQQKQQKQQQQQLAQAVALNALKHNPTKNNSPGGVTAPVTPPSTIAALARIIMGKESK